MTDLNGGPLSTTIHCYITLTLIYSQIALFITGLCIFTVFACSKPYDGKWSNIIEALVLFDLLALTILFLDTDPQSRAAVHPLALLLLLLPFLSIAFYVIVVIIVSIW